MAGGNELPFDCPTCQKCFRTGKGLACHKTRVHRDINPLQIVIRPLESNVVAPIVYPCPVCHLEWPSKRAVNGHMRKHSDRPRRGTRPPANNAGSSQSVAGLLEGTDQVPAADERAERRRRWGKAAMEMARLESRARARKEHVCKICGKTYKSHYALGGHMSHHRIRNGTAPEDQTPATAEVPSSGNDMLLVVYAFDLNELPPEED